MRIYINATGKERKKENKGMENRKERKNENMESSKRKKKEERKSNL